MAERRMFAKSIIDSDAFLDMPLSTQCLYFHLSMRADDEGFVSAPKRIMRLIGSNDDDMKLLIAKRYILTFDSGIVVIKHWRIHNYIQKDRFVPSTYTEERATLALDEKNAYTERKEGDPSLDTKCIQNVFNADTKASEGEEKDNRKSARDEEIISSLEGYGIVVDCEIPDWFDLDKLYAALNESHYLTEWKMLSKYLAHWDKIVAGYYRNYKTQKERQTEQADYMAHQYSDEQLKKALVNFDDWGE